MKIQKPPLGKVRIHKTMQGDYYFEQLTRQGWKRLDVYDEKTNEVTTFD